MKKIILFSRDNCICQQLILLNFKIKYTFNAKSLYLRSTQNGIFKTFLRFKKTFNGTFTIIFKNKTPSN